MQPQFDSELSSRDSSIEIPSWITQRDPVVSLAYKTADIDFAHRFRKSPDDERFKNRPYLTHLIRVAELLHLNGYSDFVVAAGLLHDHLEDLPSKWNKELMTKHFGSQVADLVDWVTQQDRSLSWDERNAAYAERLKAAPEEALAISLADKIANMEDSIALMEAGHSIGSILKKGWGLNSAKLHLLASIMMSRIVAPELRNLFLSTLARFDQLGAALSGKSLS